MGSQNLTPQVSARKSKPLTPPDDLGIAREARQTAADAPNHRGTQPLPHTPIRSLPAVWGCLSRHLSRLDKHPQTVSTLGLRGAPRKGPGAMSPPGDEPPATEPHNHPRSSATLTAPIRFRAPVLAIAPDK
ncbi:hypothetical protein GCM10027360_71890 [Amycolatopsis echigonensis]